MAARVSRAAVRQRNDHPRLNNLELLRASFAILTNPFFPWQIITSVAVHGHVLLTQQWVAVFVVFAGLALGE